MSELSSDKDDAPRGTHEDSPSSDHDASSSSSPEADAVSPVDEEGDDGESHHQEEQEGKSEEEKQPDDEDSDGGRNDDSVPPKKTMGKDDATDPTTASDGDATPSPGEKEKEADTRSVASNQANGKQPSSSKPTSSTSAARPALIKLALDDNFRRYFTALTKSFREDVTYNSIRGACELLEREMNRVSTGKLSKARADYFISNGLLRCLRALLARRLPGKRRTRILILLTRCVDFVVGRMHLHEHEMAQALAIIYGHTNTFYKPPRDAPKDTYSKVSKALREYLDGKAPLNVDAVDSNGLSPRRRGKGSKQVGQPSKDDAASANSMAKKSVEGKAKEGDADAEDAEKDTPSSGGSTEEEDKGVRKEAGTEEDLTREDPPQHEEEQEEEEQDGGDSSAEDGAGTRDGEGHVHRDAMEENAPSGDAPHQRCTEYAKLPPKKEDKVVMVEYLILLNYFGRRWDGFSLLMKTFGGGEDVTTRLVSIYLRSVCNMRHFLVKDWFVPYVLELKESVFARLTEAANMHQTRQLKTHVKDIHKMLESYLLPLALPEDEVVRTLDQFNLDIALDRFQTSALEKRILGLKTVKKLVERTNAPAGDKKSYMQIGMNLWGKASMMMKGEEEKPKERKEDPPKPVDAPWLMEWLSQTDFLSYLFRNPHPELIKQSIPVLEFVAKQQMLTLDTLDTLWECSVNRHESEKRAVFEAMIAVAKLLPSKTVDYMFQTIKDGLELKDYDEETLNLVHDLTLIGIKSSQKKKWYGIDTLWDLFQHRDVEEEIARYAFTRLIGLLTHDLCVPVRGHYLGLCCENVRGGCGATQSLRVIHSVLKAYPKKRRRKTIESLDHKHNLLKAFFSNLQRLREGDGASKAGKKGKKKSKRDAGASESPMRYTRVQAIGVRLSALRFLLTNSGLALSKAQVDVLWDVLVTDACDDAEREVAFAWLEATQHIKPGKHVVLSEASIHHLFERKMAAMDSTILSHAGFQLFQRYFLTINAKKDRIRAASAHATTGGGAASAHGNAAAAAAAEDASATPAYYAVSGELLGAQQMFHLAIAPEGVARDAAMDTLNGLYQRSCADAMRPKPCRVREDYVARIMKTLHHAAASHDAALPRMLEMLQRLVEGFDAAGADEGAGGGGGGGGGLAGLLKGRQDPGHPVTLNIRPVGDGMSAQQAFVLQMRSKDTIGEMKRKIAENVAKSPKSLVVVQGKDKELLHDDKSVGACGISDGDALAVKTRELEVEGTKKPLQEVDVETLLLDVLQMGLDGAGVGATPLRFARAAPKGANNASKRASRAPTRPPAAGGGGGGGGETSWYSLGGGGHEDSARSHHSSSAKDVQERHPSHPACLLSRKENFEVLYHLLDDKVCGRAAWRLISLLPPNPHISAQLRASPSLPSPVRWDDVFDPACLYKLNYSLRSVWTLLQGGAEDASSPSSSVRQRWAHAFVDAGGGAHLRNTLMGLVGSSSGTRVARAYLLRILNALVEGGGEERLEAVLGTDVAPLIDQLLEVTSQTKSKKREVEGENGDKEDQVKDTSKGDGEEEKEEEEHVEEEEEQVEEAQEEEEDDDGDDGGDDDGHDVVVAQAMHLLVSAVLGRPECFARIYQYSHIADWVCGLVLHSSSGDVRSAAAQSLTRLARTLPHDVVVPPSAAMRSDALGHGEDEEPTRVSTYLLRVLLSFLEDTESHWTQAEAYYRLLWNLLHSRTIEMDPRVLFETLGDCLIRHPIRELQREVVAGNPRVDTVVVGLMRCLRGVVRAHPQLLLDPVDAEQRMCAMGERVAMHVVDRCAMGVAQGPSTPALPVCKTRGSRAQAFALLGALGRANESAWRAIVARAVAHVQRACPPRAIGWHSNDPRHHTASTPRGRGGARARRGRRDRAVSVLGRGLADGSRAGRRGAGGGRAAPGGGARGGLGRRAHGYVGLQNQGATCYMNSLLQQLYLTTPFREGILQALDASLEPQDSLLYQMQVLFAGLHQTVRKYVDTSAFCRSVKDFDGEPIDTGVQMDANEFYNNLFDKLEGHLAGSPQARLLQEVFGGTLCNQLIPEGCNHRSEREEPFYAITLTIKDKRTIADSLRLFITGEMLQGDNQFLCEACGAKRDTLKRCVVDRLPPTLMLHLKRFEFNFDAMRNVKVNDRCEFPTTLDMEPYTKAYLQREEERKRGELSGSLRTSTAIGDAAHHRRHRAMYHLVGVVVHQGNADCGHYYSFIRVSRQGDGDPRWFEFNDTNVSEFDPERIPQECFGGEETRRYWDRREGEYRTRTRMRTNNAYILVYQRDDHHQDGGTKERDGPGHGGEEGALEVEKVKEIDEEAKGASPSNANDGNSKSDVDDDDDDDDDDVDDDVDVDDDDDVDDVDNVGDDDGATIDDEESTGVQEDDLQPRKEIDEQTTIQEEDKVAVKVEEKEEDENAVDEGVESIASNGDGVESPVVDDVGVEQCGASDDGAHSRLVGSGADGPLSRSPGMLALLLIGRMQRVAREAQQRERIEQRKKQLELWNCSGDGGEGVPRDVAQVVPEEIARLIWEDNNAFQLGNHIRGADFLEFMWDLCNTYDGSQPVGKQVDKDPSIRSDHGESAPQEEEEDADRHHQKREEDVEDKDEGDAQEEEKSAPSKKVAVKEKKGAKKKKSGGDKDKKNSSGEGKGAAKKKKKGGGGGGKKKKDGGKKKARGSSASHHSDGDGAISIQHESARVAVRFVLEVGVATMDADTMSMWVWHICRVLSRCPEAAAWWRGIVVERALELLVKHPSDRTRRACAALTSHILKLASASEGPGYIAALERAQEAALHHEEDHEEDHEEEEEEEEEEEVLERKSAAHADPLPGLREAAMGGEAVGNVLVVETMLACMPSMRPHIRGSRFFWNVLRDFAAQGRWEREYLMARRVIPNLVEFYLERGRYARASRMARYRPRAYRAGPIGRSALDGAALGGLVDTVATLVCHARTDARKKEAPPPTTMGQGTLVLSHADRTVLFDAKHLFLARALKSSTDPASAIAIMKHWSWENSRKSNVFCTMVVDQMDGSAHEAWSVYFKAVLGLLELEDSLQMARIEMVVGKLLSIELDDRRSTTMKGEVINRAHAALVNFLTQTLPQANEKAKKYLGKRSSQIKRFEHVDWERVAERERKRRGK